MINNQWDKDVLLENMALILINTDKLEQDEAIQKIFKSKVYAKIMDDVYDLTKITPEEMVFILKGEEA